jgi:hypothetical protein
MSKAQRDWDVAGPSLAAIILCAAAVEAHVGEWLAFEPQRSTIRPKVLASGQTSRFHDVIKSIVREAAGVTLGGEPWFARLRCLFHLRNALLHYYPEPRQRGSFPDKLLGCVTGKQLVPGGDDSMDWTSRLMLPDVAGQAAGIAHEAIDEFDKLVG